MTIETKRLILREMTPSDFEALQAVLSDSDIMQHYPYSFDEARVRGWIERNIERYRIYGFGLWAVCLKETGEMIGDCGLTMQMIGNVIKPEIGYHIRRDMQRKGFAREAASAVRDWTFRNTPIREIYSYMKYTNDPSALCAQSWGCTKVDEFEDEVNERTCVYRITKKEWCETIKLRKIEESDRSEAISLAWKVFQEYESPCYSQKGTDEFWHCLHDENYLAGISYYGAYDDDKLVGLIGIRLESCHLCFFFVDGHYHRMGIGRRLFDWVKGEVNGRPITLNSSPYGLPFYKAIGLTPTADEQTVNGIRFTPMVYKP